VRLGGKIPPNCNIRVKYWGTLSWLSPLHRYWGDMSPCPITYTSPLCVCVCRDLEENGDSEAVGRVNGMFDLYRNVHGPACTAVCTHVLSRVYPGVEQGQAAWRPAGLSAVYRKEFTLPDNGVEGLPKNFFVTNWLQMKELSSGEGKTSVCDACSSDGATEMKMTTVYCLECEQKLCQDCEAWHKTFKVTRRHKTVELGSESLPLKLPLNTCEKHADKYLDVYCFDCKLVVCIICYISTHSKHKCSGVNEIAGELQEQMTSDVGKISGGVDQCREMLTKIEKEKNDFTEQIAKVETEVNEKAKQ